MARIYIVEPGTTHGVGSMGVEILRNALVTKGHKAERVDIDAATVNKPKPDAWFVSCLYPRQWLHLKRMFSAIGLKMRTDQRKPSDPLVAFGGQCMIAPEPIADFADVMALGDGELTGNEIAARLDRRQPKQSIMDELAGAPGFFVPSKQSPPSAFVRVESPSFKPHLMRPSGTKDRRMVEVARGCASKCAFCSIGWAGGKYREAPKADVLALIEQSEGKHINLFAPDYSSVSNALAYDGETERHGCKAIGRDARLDRTLKHISAGGKAKSYSFGIEGLSERIRQAIAKPLANQTILEVMARLSGNVAEVKWYLILGFPSETADDYREFEALLDQTRQVYTKGRLVVSPTHLQSTPHTPLQWINNEHDPATSEWVDQMRTEWANSDAGEAQSRWLMMPIKGKEQHEHDVYLQRSSRALSTYLDRIEADEWLVRSGNWRRSIASLDLPGPHRVLAAIDPDTQTPWSHVDVGSNPQGQRLALDRFKRTMREACQ